jgi:pseudouridine-5'-phosphate glycosidase
VTPFLLAHLGDASSGRTLDANVALLRNNARIAAAIAISLATI